VDEVSAAAGSCVQQCEVGQGAGAKETETEPLWLGFGLHLECKRWRGFCEVTGPPAVVIWRVRSLE
jgi:hypothetical protein